MYSFISKALTHAAIRFPQHAPRVVEMLKNNRKDREQTIAYIGAIGENVPATGAAALEFLKDQSGEEAMHRISQIGLTNEELSQQAFDILSAQTGYVPIKHLTDYAIEKPTFTLKVLDILKNREGDFTTGKIGYIGRSFDQTVGRVAFDILKGRRGPVAASEITKIAVEFPELTHDVIKELKARPELDNSLNFGYIGREVEGMAVPMLEELRHEISNYADMQIEEIGKRVESAKGSALRILIERKSYDYARNLTQIDASYPLLRNLTAIFAARHDAVSAPGAYIAAIDEGFTTPLLAKLMTGKADFYGKKGELANMLQRAVTIIAAEKPANDNLGCDNTISNARAPQ